MPRVIHCPYCNKLTAPNLENCPHCGGFLQKRAPAPKGAGASSADALTCPNCHAKVEEGEIICGNCGTNLLTGQKIGPEASDAAPQRRFSLATWAAVGIAAAVLAAVVVAFLVWAAGGDAVDEALERARAGDEAGATRLLREHVERNPDDTRAHLELGRLLFRSNPEGAAASFEQAMTRNPYAARMAVLSLAASRAPQARQRQIEALRNLLRLEPHNVQARLLLALAYGTAGQPQQQAEVLNELATDGETDARVHMFQAIAHALQGEIGEADYDIAQALALEPGDPDLLAVRGFIASMAGDSPAAIDNLRAGLGASAAGGEILLELGVLLLSEGAFSAAEPYLSAAVQRPDAGDAARFFHALTLHAVGREDAALREFEVLAQQRGEYAARAAIQAADIYLGRGSQERAREMLETAALLEVDSAQFHTARGRLEMLAGDWAAARDAFRRAVQRDPSYPGVHLESGLLYVQQEVFSEAVSELERYLELVGPEAEGVRVDEVAALVEQLRQTIGGQMPAVGRRDPRQGV